MSAILAELNDAFQSDPDIDEIGVVLAVAPPSIVLQEHKLGITATVLKPLLKYCLQQFYALTMNIKDYASISSALATEIIGLTRAILCIRGNFPLAFSCRKAFLTEGLISIERELLFLNVLFTKHPKCPASWEHRRWCLTFNTRKGAVIGRLPVVELQKEKELCRQMAESYPKNYYAWMHRLWLLSSMSRELLEEELHFTKSWLLAHVSDHCASNHRIQVILRLIRDSLTTYDTSTDSRQLLDIETSSTHGTIRPELETHGISSHAGTIDIESKLDNLCKYWRNRGRFLSDLIMDSDVLIQTRPGSETLWYHRRDIMSIILDSLYPQDSSRSHQSQVTMQSMLALLQNRMLSARTIPISTVTATETTDIQIENIEIVSDSKNEYFLSGVGSMLSNAEEMIDDNGTEISYQDGYIQIFSTALDSEEYSILCAELYLNHSIDTTMIAVARNDKLLQQSKRIQFVYMLLQSELSFVKLCAEHPSYWNASKQRSYSIRYLIYLLHLVSIMK